MANKFLDAIQSNIDSFGVISQLNGDGSGTLLHEADLVFCSYISGMKLNDSFGDTMGVIERFRIIVPRFIILDKSHSPSYGLFRRHPDLTKWYSHWDRGSADQMHAMIAMALVESKVHESHSFGALISNWRRHGYLFTTNTLGNSEMTTQRKVPDFTLARFWAYAIRCSAISKQAPVSKWLRPILELFDLSLVANSLIRVYIHGKDRNETDSRNHLKAMGLAKLKGDTWMAKLARRIYRNMPIKFPERLGAAKQYALDTLPRAFKHIFYYEGAQQEIDDYFNSNGGVSGLATLWAPVVKWILD